MALFTLLFIAMPASSLATQKTTHEHNEEELSFSQLKLGWTVASFNPFQPRRGPLSYVPPEETVTVPLRQDSAMVTEIFAQDESGVMNETIQQMQEWDRQEQYAKQWNLEDTGLYTPVTVDEKREYLMKRSFKYLDKRLHGESKKAKPGSTLATVGQVQQALRPASEVGISEKVKIKFKAQMLEGEAKVSLINPVIDSYTEVQTDQNLSSGHAPSKINSARMHVGKTFKDLGLNTGVDYQAIDGTYVASSTKDIFGGLKSRVSTNQPKIGFEDTAEHKVELLFDTGF